MFGQRDSKSAFLGSMEALGFLIANQRRSGSSQAAFLFLVPFWRGAVPAAGIRLLQVPWNLHLQDQTILSPAESEPTKSGMAGSPLLAHHFRCFHRVSGYIMLGQAARETSSRARSTQGSSAIDQEVKPWVESIGDLRCPSGSYWACASRQTLKMPRAFCNRPARPWAM